MNFEETLAARRESVAKTLRPIDVSAVAAMGEDLFPFPDDPWREKFFAFVAENPNATLHHAQLPEEGEILYSHTHGRGIWFIPGKAMGIIQPKGLAVLAEIVNSAA